MILILSFPANLDTPKQEVPSHVLICTGTIHLVPVAEYFFEFMGSQRWQTSMEANSQII
jgi:hypothetical protein